MAGSDVVIVGGGIIGAACAYELARSGASVTLLERAELARRAGATIRHHLPGRRLLSRGETVTGVVTDDGVIECDTVVLAAGPWSTGVLRALGIHIPVRGARGWLIQLAPPRPLLSHWVEGSARTLWRREVEPVSAGEFSEGVARDDIGAVIQPSPDGTIVAGTSREPP